MVYPFSPRRAFRVNDAKKAEKAVHDALELYRIRSDREFFAIDYKQAVEIIEKVLESNGFMYYKYDK